MTKIPALSIQQPWAELIMSGKKSIEIRAWTTEYRGVIWVHTGAKSNSQAERYFSLQGLYKGGYIGVISVESVFSFDTLRWQQLRDNHLDPGRYRSGLYGWVLSKPLRFERPIDGPGQLQLYYPSPDILKELEDALNFNR